MTTKKADYIWFNGEMVRWEDAKVHVMSHALHYGTSVFEGIRCYDSHKGPVVFRHREHMQRLRDSAKIYRFPVSQSVDELMEACRAVLRKNNLTSAYIRPLVFVGDVGMGVNPPDGYSTDVIIAAFPWGAYLGAEALDQGIDAMVSSWNRAAPNTIPTAAKAGGNYLSSLLVGSEARRHGYQEGIALDVNGYISEGAGENLFEVKDGVLFTPPFTSSALPGITRDAIIKLAKDLGLEVREQVLSRESLYLADEEAMTAFGARIAQTTQGHGLIFLEGDLGAGKTTLVRAVLRALGHAGPVKSPTYTLVEVYVVSSIYLYHFDFYRFNEPEEFADAGLGEYFRENAVCLVEWPEKAAGYVPPADLALVFSFPDEAVDSGRRLELFARSEVGQKCLNELSKFQLGAGGS